ncbi:unnamed protein product [Medioppia subpectinata]|uniref:Uncharacterized protein n=1 Tax=Medioppia subpectinata TaxID=1979941 RepID=A0A7R9KRG7_9ACAR|nr:unnamed protein product [Medioppia subpectinata]CAG2108372.1 unnamed protein product [Medioppia subpectinata]
MLEIVTNLSKDGEAERVFTETVKTFKRLDVLVNNAGDYIKANATDDNFLDVLNRSLKVDLKASLTLIRLFEPYLKQSKGNVVNISSVFTERPQICYLGYVLAKQALEMSTTTLALELGPHGIRVNSVGVGVVDSHETHSDSGNKVIAKSITCTPLGRVGTPGDIAKGVVFLSSSDASFITGHNLVVDGGYKYNKSRDFTGKVVLVTGSAIGVGEAIAKLYSALGASVVITGRREDGVKRVAKECQELSPNKLKALKLPADLTVDGEAERVFNETIKTFKRLDVLVNNAGAGYVKASGTDDKVLDVLDKSLAIDLRTPLTLIQLFEPYLKQSKGNIINITSVFTKRPQKYHLGYQLGKQALEMSTTTLALELAPHGIRVNSVSIGIIRSYTTPETLNDPNVVKAFADSAKQTPLGYLATPFDIAKGVVFLSSSDASFITGHNLVIDGGLQYNMDSQHFPDFDF